MGNFLEGGGEKKVRRKGTMGGERGGRGTLFRKATEAGYEQVMTLSFTTTQTIPQGGETRED